MSSPSPHPTRRAESVSAIPPFHPSPIGLQNLGNTCYANTALQCLMHTHALTSYIIRGTYEQYLTSRAKVVDASDPSSLTAGPREDLSTHPLTGTPSRAFLQAYADCLREIWSRFQVQQQLLAQEASVPHHAPHHAQHQPPFNPSHLFGIGTRASSYRVQRGETTSVFAVGQQHDIAEYLQFVLDVLHDTAQCQVDMALVGVNADRRDQMMAKALHQFKQHYAKQYSFVTDMMTGQYFVQNLTCDNKAPTEHSETYDPFVLLTLDLPLGKRQCTLYDCFDLMIAPEIIHGWQGELSQEPRMIERRTFLWRLPSVLIIHLKRFANRVVKNGCVVGWAPTLDLRDYCPGDDAQHAQFELYAVANHEGSLQYGHYYADCKKSNGNWYRFNDAQVTEIGEDALRGEAAYVLFYRRIGGVVGNASE